VHHPSQKVGQDEMLINLDALTPVCFNEVISFYLFVTTTFLNIFISYF